ncbi:MAG TPA: helix-turn-helix domain-containing protein [Longimicrobium sp.]|nr:helix-turn-helix domain-containing protein [Longimicrobium sp.]
MSADLLLVSNHDTGQWAEEGFPARALRSPDEVREAFAETTRLRKPVLWIADHPEQVVVLAAEPPVLVNNNRLLVLNKTRRPERDLLQIVFRIVLAPDKGVHLPDLDEMKEILAAPNREDLLVGAVADPANEMILLYRGNLQPVIVPYAWFSRRDSAPRPNFKDVEITDYGQTLRLGTYEASTDAILYAHDPAYRRAAKERLVQQDASFGGALRRLRLLKGVARCDFPGISEKQIARIERGEIAKPHKATVTSIAERLGVHPSDIPSY